jgi:hypothetical protein
MGTKDFLCYGSLYMERDTTLTRGISEARSLNALPEEVLGNLGDLLEGHLLLLFVLFVCFGKFLESEA